MKTLFHVRISFRPPVYVELQFQPRDLWVGLYWKRYPKAIETFWCVIPMFPIVVYVQWGF